jgi:hypothetical protein
VVAALGTLIEWTGTVQSARAGPVASNASNDRGSKTFIINVLEV